MAGQAMSDWGNEPLSGSSDWGNEPLSGAGKAARASQADKPGLLANIAGAVIEPALAMGSGMIAKPLGDVAGLARLGMEGLRRAGASFIDERDPLSDAQAIQRGLTYEPVTPAGQAVTKWNPLSLLGQGVNWLGGKAEQMVAPPATSGPVQTAVGSGVHELVNQVPMLLGVAPSAGPVVMGRAQWLMNNALKPPSGTPKMRRQGERAVDTLLDEGVNVSRGGIDTLRDRVAAMNNDIEQIIQNSPKTIDKAAVVSRLADTARQFSLGPDPIPNLTAIQGIENAFMGHPLIPGTTMPIQLAQAMKQQGYRELGDAPFGQFTGAQTSARKDVIRGLKEEIAQAEPAVGPANARESALLDTLPLVERRVYMHAKQDPGGFVAWMAHSPERALAFMATRSDIFKSLLARALASASEGTPVTRPIAGALTTEEANAQQNR